MRILLVTPDFPPAPGGIQNLVARLAGGLAERHEVRVITARQPGAATWDRGRPFHVRRIPAARSGVAKVMVTTVFALAQIARWRPEVILCGHVIVSPPCRLAESLLGIPYVVMGYGSEFGSRRMRRVAQLGMRAAACVVTISEFTRRAILAHGVDTARVAIVKPGHGLDLVDDVAFSPLSGDGRLLLTVSRLVEPYKGHDAVIRALPLVLAKVPDARYVIVGDGPLRPYLERLAASMGVTGSVTFTGRLETAEVVAWYRRCEVFVLASRDSPSGGGAEGFGMVFLEAGLFGKPVIAGRSGGIGDAVEDGVTGLLVAPTDPGEIADAVVGVLQNRQLATRLGTAGRRRATVEFAWPRYVSAFEQILEAARSGRS